MDKAKDLVRLMSWNGKNVLLPLITDNTNNWEEYFLRENSANRVVLSPANEQKGYRLKKLNSLEWDKL